MRLSEHCVRGGWAGRLWNRSSAGAVSAPGDKRQSPAQVLLREVLLCNLL